MKDLTIHIHRKKIADVLSSREKQIFKLIVEGLENKAIAKRLFISIKTVEFHKENIKHKLGFKNVGELYNMKLTK
jgi:two-component system, NarL family, response regulator NreC